MRFLSSPILFHCLSQYTLHQHIQAHGQTQTGQSSEKEVGKDTYIHSKTQSNSTWFLLSERPTAWSDYQALPLFWGRHGKEYDTRRGGPGPLLAIVSGRPKVCSVSLFVCLDTERRHRSRRRRCLFV